MPARERDERLMRRHAMSDIRLQYPLDDPRHVGRRHVAIELTRERGIGTETAADMDVIALDRIGVLGRLHLAGDEPDVADIVLRAGVMTAGQVNVHRHVDGHAFLAPLRDRLGVRLGVGGRKPAAAISRTRDQSGADRCRRRRKTECGDAGFGFVDTRGGNA